MSNTIRRGLFAAAGLIGGLVGSSARADGDIEKPPGVPPEVTAAKCNCPTLTGPCHGFYPTRWRVLGDCCVAPAPAVPAPGRPTEIPPASRLRAAATEKAPPVADLPPIVSKPTPVKSSEPLPVVKPLSAKMEVTRPEPLASAPEIVIPAPSSAPKGDAGANRPISIEVVPDSSRLRK